MKKQNIIIVLLFLCVFTLAVGYVIFKTNVEVSEKTASSKDLNVIFKSIGNIKEVDCTNSTALISKDRKNVTISVPNLQRKGAYAEFPITIKNIGTIPARLESIFQYGLGNDAAIIAKYDGIGITDNILYPGFEKMFTVKVMWWQNSWSGKSNYDFTIEFNYVQAR